MALSSCAARGPFARQQSAPGPCSEPRPEPTRKGTAAPGGGGSGTSRWSIAATSRINPVAAFGRDLATVRVTMGSTSAAAQAGGRSDLLAINRAPWVVAINCRSIGCRAFRPIEDQQHQVGRSEFLPGPFDAQVLDHVVGSAQARCVGQLDRPTAERRPEGHDVSRRARRAGRRSHAENRQAH